MMERYNIWWWNSYSRTVEKWNRGVETVGHLMTDQYNI